MENDKIFRGALGFGFGVCFDVFLYLIAVSWIAGGDGVYSPLYFLISPFGLGVLIWPIAGAFVFSFSSRAAMIASAGMLAGHHLGFVVQASIWKVELLRDLDWMWWMRSGYAFTTVFLAVAWPVVLWAGVAAYFLRYRKIET